MTDKELRRMSRKELIELIYRYQQQAELQDRKLGAMQSALADRRIKVQNAGSIAEAALAMNDVFTAAQAAADQYLQELQCSAAQAEAEKQKILLKARREAGEILRLAKEKAKSYDQE